MMDPWMRGQDLHSTIATVMIKMIMCEMLITSSSFVPEANPEVVHE